MDTDPQQPLPSRDHPAPPGIRYRYYAIRSSGFYSLREAAQLLGVPEDRIRRAILLEDLPSIDVADERHYLLAGETLQKWVRSERPEEKCRFTSDGSGWHWAAGLCGLVIVSLGFFRLVPDSQWADLSRAPTAQHILTAPAPPHPPSREGVPAPEAEMKDVPPGLEKPNIAAGQGLPCLPGIRQNALGEAKMLFEP